uniref:Protein phosphatase 1 regulatory subunit 32 n=1 Tax=Varanus komodoensis TaxID=61221 RepID=A0A8D2IZ44_VARKO
MYTMGRLPLGVVSPYVRTSSGGSMDPMKFYCTSYGTAYGREGFRPRNGFHSGAGYKSNYRPVVQYKPSLDKLDNPAHFQPLQLPDGKYPLPWSVHQSGSGYDREKPLSFPTTKAVSLQNQGSALHCSNGGVGEHVVLQMFWLATPTISHHYHLNCLVLPLNLFLNTDFLQKKTIGAKEETGFTEGCLANPIVDKPTSQVLPVEYVSLLLCILRIMLSMLQNEALVVPPPAEVPGPLSHSQYQGLQQQPQTQTSLLGREHVGNKEPTGFSLNNLSYVSPAYDPDLPNRFLTSYNSKFYENIPKGVDREGWTRGGIQPQKAGGFATNNHPTGLGTDPNATEILRTVHPHVGRTITTVDPFYRDSPHDRRFTALHQTTVPN